MVKDNLLISEFTVEGIPAGPPGQEIDLRFTYDVNGVLECEATIAATKKKVTHVVTRYAKGLSKKELAKALEDLQALKIDPRDQSENRYLLTWAERMYRELPLIERQMLDQLVCGFEAALEISDSEAVERHREGLRQFLSMFDSHDGGCEEPTDE